jgi:hypothetical protein
MWFDPTLELNPYGFHHDAGWGSTNPRWLMWLTQDTKRPPVGFISWREWRRLLAGLFTVLMMLILKREEHQVTEAGPTLTELRSYPLHQPGEDASRFSLN